MKKIIKVSKILIIIMLVFSTFYTSMASVTENFKGTTMIGDAAGIKVTNILGVVLDVLRNIGVGIAIIILLILGCKYMIASAGERAEIKKHAVTYVIGAVVLFSASSLLNIIKNFALEVTKT